MKVLLYLIFSVMMLSCAKPKAVLTYTEPPKYYRGTIGSIAVLPFDGKGVDGNMIAAEIEASLLRAGKKGKPPFKVVSRSYIDRVISELRLSSSGLTAESLELGRLLKAEGLLLGSAELLHGSEFFYRRVSECVETKGSGLIKECVRYVERSVPCSKRFVQLTLVPKLIDVERGEVVYSRRIVSTKLDVHCAGDWGQPKSLAELFSEAKAEAIGELVRDIAPYRVSITVEFMDEYESIAGKALFEKAIDLIKEGRIEEACRLFDEIEEEDYSLLYNKGLCREIEGDLEKAEELYRRALSLKHDRNVESALRRVERRRSLIE
jgi:tetratricopeptide (TPR) repeat protein